MKLTIFKYTLITLLGMIAGSSIIYYIYPPTVQGSDFRYIETTKYIDNYIEVPRPVYINIPVEVEKPVYITQIVEKSVPVVLQNFPDMVTLADWITKNTMLFASFDNTGTIDFSGQVSSNYNCVDYATRFQELAMKDGYILNTQIINNRKLNGYIVTDIPGTHMINLARIEEKFYTIEPQTGQITYCGSKGK
jgi:hypothetical protein